MVENPEVALEGTWIYDESILCNVRIIKSNIFYGSGDYEDPPEIRDDEEIECFYIEFESMTQKGNFCSSRGGYLTLSEAISEAERVTNQKINWIRSREI
jgi:hypothetical protein